MGGNKLRNMGAETATQLKVDTPPRLAACRVCLVRMLMHGSGN